MNFKIEENRIYNEKDGKLMAEATIPVIEDGIVDIDSTFVDPELRGKGIASELMKATVEEIAKRGLKTKASCPYAKAWFEKNGDEFSVLIK